MTYLTIFELIGLSSMFVASGVTLLHPWPADEPQDEAWGQTHPIEVYWCFQKYGKTPKSSILIGFSIIFTIHFGAPYLWKHPYLQ